MHLILAFALTIAAPASAQDRSAEIEFENRLREMREAAAKTQAAMEEEQKARTEKADRDLVETTLTAMADGNPVGESIVGFLRETGIQVRILPQKEKSKVTVLADGTRNLSLSGSLPKYPRVLAPHIAREAAQLQLAAMPDSAEKEYMIRSAVSRSWLELGGEKRGLPVIEPLIKHADAELTEYMSPWIQNRAEMALYRIREATGKKELAELDAPEARAAEKAFVAFLMSENEWRKLYSAD